MEKKIITQSEFTSLFNEWLKSQTMPDFKETIDRKKWWIGKIIEFDKLTKDEYDVIDQERTDFLL